MLHFNGSLERGYLLRATNEETVWTLHEEHPDRLFAGGRFLPTPLPNVWSLSRALHAPQTGWSIQLTLGYAKKVCRKDASNFHFDYRHVYAQKAASSDKGAHG